MKGDVLIMIYQKGEETYAFAYTDKTRDKALRKFGQFASNPELSFTWYDAAVMSQRVREEHANIERNYRGS